MKRSLLIVLPLLCFPVGGEEPKPVAPVVEDPTPDQAFVPQAEPEAAPVDRSILARMANRPGFAAQLSLLLRHGVSHQGVRLPQYRETEVAPSGGDIPAPLSTEGRPQPLASLFQSEVMTRLDENHLQFQKARYENFDDPVTDEDETQIIELQRGILDLSNDILVSNEPVKIQTGTMTIEAGAMLRDNTTELTKFSNGVHIILNVDAPADAESAPTPDPPAK
jgi:hypothetical protein